MKKIIRFFVKCFGIEKEIRKDERNRISNDMINHSGWFNKTGNEKVANCLYIYGRLLSKHATINISALRATVDDFGDTNIQFAVNEPILRKLNWGIDYAGADGYKKLMSDTENKSKN